MAQITGTTAKATLDPYAKELVKGFAIGIGCFAFGYFLGRKEGMVLAKAEISEAILCKLL